MQELVDITKVMLSLTQARNHAMDSNGHVRPSTAESLRKSILLAISTGDGYVTAVIGPDGELIPDVDAAQAVLEFEAMRRSVMAVIDPPEPEPDPDPMPDT